MKSQDDRVLSYLTHRGSLTQKKADKELAVMRLGAVVHRLKGQGHNIKSTLIKVSNRFGQVCKVAEYELLGEGMLI